MNFLQLVQRLAVEAGVSGATSGPSPRPTTTVGQSGEMARLVNWVNDAWLDIQSIHQDWDWQRTSTTWQTVAGQYQYTPAQCNATNFGSWAGTRDTFRNYVNPIVTISHASPGVVYCSTHGLAQNDQVAFSVNAGGSLPSPLVVGTYYYANIVDANNITLSTTMGGTPINTTTAGSGIFNMTSLNLNSFIGYRTEVFTNYLEYDNWRDVYQYGALRSIMTRPIEMSITPAKAIAVGPFPDQGYTMVGDYFQAPSYFTSDISVPTLPAQFHMIIVYLALLRYGMHEGAANAIQQGQMEYTRLLRKLNRDRKVETLVGGAIA